MALDKLRILPDLHDAEYDDDEYVQEHYAIFGHWPPRNPRIKCEHPIHAAVAREMNGATGITPFDGEMIVSDDSVLEAERQGRYNEVFDATRQFQRQVEEEDEQKRLMDLGLIPTKRIY